MRLWDHIQGDRIRLTNGTLSLQQLHQEYGVDEENMLLWATNEMHFRGELK